MHFWGTNVFDDTWPVYQEAAKRTNITLHGTASKTNTESDQVFNTMLTSEPLPDIIHGESKNLNKAGTDGALIPLQDLVDKYAPHIKAILMNIRNIKRRRWQRTATFITYRACAMMLARHRGGLSVRTGSISWAFRFRPRLTSTTIH